MLSAQYRHRTGANEGTTQLLTRRHDQLLCIAIPPWYSATLQAPCRAYSHNSVGQGSLKKQYTHEIGCFGYIDVSSQLECLQNQRECCAPGALHVHKRRHMHGLGHILALRPEQERHPLAPGCISHLRYALPHPPAGSTLAVVHADRVLSVSSADRRCQQQHSPCACI